MTVRWLNNVLRKQDTIDQIRQYLANGEPPQMKKLTEDVLKEFEMNGEDLVHKPSAKIVVDTDEREELLQEEYADLKKSAGLGINSFYRVVSEHYLGISRDQVRRFLTQQPAYQLTKHFQKSINKPILAKKPGQMFAIDLVDMSRFQGDNHAKRYILVCVDVFSRYVWCAPLRNKTAADVAREMKKIFEDAEMTPTLLLSDNGLEFRGELSELCNEQNTKQIFTRSYSPESNGIVESINKQIRRKLSDGMVRNKTRRWTLYLEDAVENWNTTRHSGMAYDPSFLFLSNSEDAKEEQDEVRKHMVKKAIRAVARNRAKELKQGDVVRVLLSTQSGEMRKQMKTNKVSNLKWAPVKWSPDLFKVRAVITPKNHIPFAGKQKLEYTLETLEGQSLGAGKRWFANQLQLVAKAGDPIPEGAEMPRDLAKKLNRLRDEAPLPPQPQPQPQPQQPPPPQGRGAPQPRQQRQQAPPQPPPQRPQRVRRQRRDPDFEYD